MALSHQKAETTHYKTLQLHTPQSRSTDGALYLESNIEALPFVKRDGINWISVTAFTAFHAGAFAALFFFSWPAYFTAIVLYWISLSLGIGMIVNVPL